MNISELSARVATLGPIGYAPLAPGAAGTLAALPLVYFIGRLHLSGFWYAVLTLGVALFALVVIAYALPEFKGDGDPRPIIIDEVAGTVVTFCMAPIAPWSLVLGFILFRTFDTLKIFGIIRIENLSGSFGILLDDVAAGFLSAVILRVVFYFIS